MAKYGAGVMIAILTEFLYSYLIVKKPTHALGQFLNFENAPKTTSDKEKKKVKYVVRM